MGFYIRKSFRSGPFRVNLSKSGLGFSSGFKGFRVGTGPRGGYVHAGGKGLYYRKSFGRGRRRRIGHPLLSLLLVIVVLAVVVHFWKVLLALAALVTFVWVLSVVVKAWLARPTVPTESDQSSPVPLQEFSSSGELAAPPELPPPTPALGEAAGPAEAERQRQAADHRRVMRQRAESEEQRVRKAAVAEEERAFQWAAEEAERRHAWQLTRWPKGTTLDSHIAQIDGLSRQVALQNEKIESQIQHLNDLLHNGLREQPQAKPTAAYRAGDPKGIAEHIELVLTAVQLGTAIPKVRVAFSPQSRQLVIEYELPTVDVIPKAKSYRYVKSQDKVVETARPASQVKRLYTSAIAQVTLLCLARIFRVDTEQHINVVVFNGVVNATDLRTGKPIQPRLITVRTTRETFSQIDLAQVDPVACLKYLDAGISRNPIDLEGPVQEFSCEKTPAGSGPAAPARNDEDLTGTRRRQGTTRDTPGAGPKRR